MKPRSARMMLSDMLARAGLSDFDLPQLDISGMTADSRAVGEGFLFAALPGTQSDGRRFIGAAVQRGAAAVLAPTGTVWPMDVPRVPLVTHDEPRRVLALLAAAQETAQPETIVAVTGTNGKTSTVDFLRQLWTASGIEAASLGTLGLIAPGHPGGSGLTTPDPVALAKMFAGLAHEGVTHAAIEASSHGLDQFRLDGMRLLAAGFSNLTRDHLDYHGSVERYRSAKLRLFAELLPHGAPAVVNADMDRDTLHALRAIAAARGLDLRTVGEAGSYTRLISATALPHGQILRVAIDGGAAQDIAVALPGRFQADNALMAAALAEATGLTNAWSLLPLLRGVRGRMELAVTLPNGAAAYVDYAHTPDALQRLLQALRPHTAGRLVCVFGCGGDRDAGKRPLMGEIVQRLADVAIVTDDNPRTENAHAIRRAIMAACPGAREIGDRAGAIAAGLAELRAGDVLVVAGKGHEQGQIVGRDTLPFDDASVLRALAGAV
jgi:UDP-N-acetylmuramoyl-L-alanyl-D-glutamate--2,6-diaminopimelate ligase